MAANKAGKEHRLGRKGIVQRIQTELVRLPIVLEDSERLPVDACLSGPCRRPQPPQFRLQVVVVVVVRVVSHSHAV